MLKFAKAAPYFPDPARAKPNITDEDRQRAAGSPPHAVPFHCKPWVDGGSIGWTLFYGYVTPVTITNPGAGKIQVENLPRLAGESNQPRIIEQFARDHFGIGSGYTLKTEPGHMSLLLPASHPPPGLEAVPGVIETDWYPRQVFLVFRVPPPGTRIFLDHKMELARVVVVPRETQAESMTAAELTEIKTLDAQYAEEERTTPSRWQDANGQTFTHLYREWSRKFRP